MTPQGTGPALHSEARACPQRLRGAGAGVGPERPAGRWLVWEAAGKPPGEHHLGCLGWGGLEAHSLELAKNWTLRGA